MKQNDLGCKVTIGTKGKSSNNNVYKILIKIMINMYYLIQVCELPLN